MNSHQIKQKIFPLIKAISIILISSAIALQLWDIQALITHHQLPTSLNPILIIGRLALLAHFIEGIIAAYYANSKNKFPLQYAAYTFFVGTIGLLELWENPEH
ncbi:hypothetical protein VB711_03420 [Cronbergia sp. UHCC 0137]|nr:hypothetical protein [Cronbergia sp. UHCC 0137]MEA5616893.1 hypothetical protein [Cronbergia sp. UHCC 0137]